MTKRTRKVTFRLSDNELAHLHEIASKSSYSMEEYLRSLISGIVSADRPPPDYLSMMRELHAIGANLNQIAQKAHVLGVIDVARYDTEAKKLSAAIVEIVRVVKAPRRL